MPRAQRVRQKMAAVAVAVGQKVAQISLLIPSACQAAVKVERIAEVVAEAIARAKTVVLVSVPQ